MPKCDAPHLLSTQETLIIFNSLLNGTFVAQSNIHPGAEAAQRLGQTAADHIFSFLDDRFYYAKIEALDPVHLSDLRPAHPHGPRHHYTLRNVVSHPELRATEEPKPDRTRSVSMDAQALEAIASVAAASVTVLSPRPSQQLQSSACLSPSASMRAAASTLQVDYKVDLRSPSRKHKLSEVAFGEEEQQREEEQVEQERSEAEPETPQEVLAHAGRLYTAGYDKMPLSPEEREQHKKLRAQLESATGHWLRSSTALLEAISDLGAAKGITVRHVIVTTGQLVATLGKMLMFGLPTHLIPADNVYSASKQTKLAVFKKLRQRFGVMARYMAIGDGAEERRAAGIMRWPFLQMSLHGLDEAQLACFRSGELEAAALEAAAAAASPFVDAAPIYPAVGGVTVHQIRPGALIDLAMAGRY